HIGYGNASNNFITGNGVGMLILEGRGGDDTLIGGQYDDILRGGSANDTLDGGEGHDTLTGGAGDDTYRINGNSRWDSVTELLGEGPDTIVCTPGLQLRVRGQSPSPPHYTLRDNLENLTIDGARRG